MANILRNEELIAEHLKKANSLPLLPGVYLMHGADDSVIYVGKAKKLKNRVAQYFRKGATHPPKVSKMVSCVRWFEYIVCDSEFEALILECSLIKQYSPKYNILLKDDKGYHYLKIVKGDRPSIEHVKLKQDDGAEYIGPYHSGWVVRQTVEQARKIFKLSDCSRALDGRGKPCLNYHIGLCSAPCAGKVSKKDYMESFGAAIDFIKRGGCDSDELESLRKKMEIAAENLEFELAARLRDRISAIEKIYEKQKVITSDDLRQDVFGFVEAGGSVCVEVFRFHNGILSDREQHILEPSGSKEAIRSAFLKGYYLENQDIPPIILIDGATEDAELIEQWLSGRSGRKCSIIVPQRGKRLQTVQMCSANAAEYLSKMIQRSGRETEALDELAKLLGLDKAPRRIEAYDISNTAGSSNVGAMTVFQDGRPSKSDYRKFRIKSFIGQDDYRSMAEVLERRFNEYRMSTPGFSELPDLILLDGSTGQISAVLPVLERLGITVPVFGMVKDSKHRTRAIAAKGGEIAIKANRRAYTLITTIQDETHRFAISFHHKTAGKTAFASELTSIEGIGKTRAVALMKGMRTIAAIKNASVDELSAIKGMNRPSAERVYQHFHPDKSEHLEMK